MNKPRKPPRRRIDGVLLLDKPAGMTSNAALQKAKWLLNAAKAGHTGTLDPMATGLLPICFGEATKFAGELLGADKCYAATVRLGVRTDTADAEGRVLETHPVSVTREQVEAVLARFRGDIQQVPPMHSALKRDGRPLYEYARKGIELERAPRAVSIYALNMCNFDADQVNFEVDCSKGTYVRTLAQDIGDALGCGGPPRTVTGLQPEDAVQHWNDDGTVLVTRDVPVPCKVERVNLQTGKREPFVTLTPNDAAGVTDMSPVGFTDDLKSCLYGYTAILSRLYVMEDHK